MEALSMIAALVAVFGVVLAKAMVTVRARAMKRRIAEVDHEKARILGNLKSLQAKSKVSGTNHSSLQKKRDRLRGRLGKLRAELGELSADEERRELQRERTRGKLIRPPGGASAAAGEELPGLGAASDPG